MCRNTLGNKIKYDLCLFKALPFVLDAKITAWLGKSSIYLFACLSLNSVSFRSFFLYFHTTTVLFCFQA